MCTYNGARFLLHQLESIAAQTRLPNELVVCDDRSADESLEIVRSFAKRAPFPVRLEINEKNLGSTKNFEKAIGLCQGEIIALADQDDVWKPRKLAVLEKTLEEHPEAGYVFSDAELVDVAGRPLGRTLWSTIRFQGSVLRSFSGSRQVAILLRRAAAQGAATAFRSRLNSVLLPISPHFGHDYWISLLASSVALYGVAVREQLIHYRQHDRQQIGPGSKSVVEKIRRAREEGAKGAGPYDCTTQGFQDVRERLLLAASKGLSYPPNHLCLIEEKIAHCGQRAAAHSTRGTAKLSKVISEVLTGRYERYSDSWRSVVRDLCF